MIPTTAKLAILSSLTLTSLSAAAPVSVAMDNLLSGVSDEGGSLVTTATAKLGWFQSAPEALGADIAALEDAFIEVGSTTQGGFSEFNTAFNFDDTDTFEGVPYSEFAGQAMYGLMVDATGNTVGVVRFSETFPVGQSAVPPDTSSSAGWNPGTATPVVGAFSGDDIGGGSSSFQMVPAVSGPGAALVIAKIAKVDSTVTITYQSGGAAIDLYRSPNLDDFSAAQKIATDEAGDGTVEDPTAPLLTAFYVIVPKGQTP